MSKFKPGDRVIDYEGDVGTITNQYSGTSGEAWWVLWDGCDVELWHLADNMEHLKETAKLSRDSFNLFKEAVLNCMMSKCLSDRSVVESALHLTETKLFSLEMSDQERKERELLKELYEKYGSPE